MGEAVRLTVVGNEGEAMILCSMLRVEGVQCIYRPTDLSAGPTGASDSWWHEVLVDEADLERARGLLPAQ